MKIKIAVFFILGMSITNFCLAQSREPSLGSESSSTGVWPSTSSDTSAGYDSGDHGNVS